jgi:hypothetical protein
MVLAGAMLMFGCGGGGSGGASPNSPAAAFVGTFQSVWTSTAIITSPPGVPPQSYNDTGVITVTAQDDHDIEMSFQVGANAANGSITFSVNGSSAVATGTGTGGSCWMGKLNNGNQQTTCATSARATIAGNMLTQSQSGNIRGTTLAGVAYTGTYQGTWTGTRTGQ